MFGVNFTSAKFGSKTVNEHRLISPLGDTFPESLDPGLGSDVCYPPRVSQAFGLRTRRVRRDAFDKTRCIDEGS